MKKIKYLIIITYLISVIFLTQPVSTLIANSSNYSVSMFGTGMATANPSSTNYNSTFLSETMGTTRNAESNSLIANIGFFENTVYYKTISITSYSIYPKSAVQGSIIKLSISALNSQSVWAILTSPTGTSETIVLTNNINTDYTANSIGTYTIIFYANNSQGNLDSIIDTFEITPFIIPPVSPPPTERSETITIIEKCTYVWDCTPWSICLEGIQQRECKNIGTCTGTEGKPIETRVCSDALFDIVMELNETELIANKTLKFGITLTEMKGIEKIDIQIKYSIIDSNNAEVFSQIETRAIEGNLSYEKQIEELELADGEYILRVDILYGNLQRAFAEQKIKIGENKIKNEQPVPNIEKTLEILNNYKEFIIIIIAIGLLTSFILKKEEHHKKFKKKTKNKKKYFVYGLFALSTSIFLMIIIKTNIVQKITNNLPYYNWKLISILSAIIIFIILITLLRKKLLLIYKKITKFILEIIPKNKKHAKNSIKGLMNKKVYSEKGDYIGKIKDIILKENKINNLKIQVDKKHKSKSKRIIIKYNNVKDVGNIVIIDSKILDKLNSLKY